MVKIHYVWRVPNATINTRLVLEIIDNISSSLQDTFVLSLFVALVVFIFTLSTSTPLSSPSLICIMIHEHIETR